VTPGAPVWLVPQEHVRELAAFPKKRGDGAATVTPAGAGVQKGLERLDSRLRGNDSNRAYFHRLRIG